MADNTLSARVARNVRAALATRRLTQEWLAEATGIPVRTLARRLHPTHPSPMSLDELAVIAGALDASVTALLPASVAAQPLAGGGEGTVAGRARTAP